MKIFSLLRRKYLFFREAGMDLSEAVTFFRWSLGMLNGDEHTDMFHVRFSSPYLFSSMKWVHVSAGSLLQSWVYLGLISSIATGMNARCRDASGTSASFGFASWHTLGSVGLVVNSAYSPLHPSCQPASWGKRISRVLMKWVLYCSSRIQNSFAISSSVPIVFYEWFAKCSTPCGGLACSHTDSAGPYRAGQGG